MNKKLKEIFARFEQKSSQAREYQSQGKIAEASAAIAEAQDILAEYNNEKALYDLEKQGIPEDGKPAAGAKASGFTAMAKMIMRRQLSDTETAIIKPGIENALVTGGTAGENFLVPEDIDNTIREYRQAYVELKQLVTLIPTYALSGAETFAKKDSGKLSAINDGTELNTASGMAFEQKRWTIGFYGDVFPVSNVLIGAEKAGLMSYINRFFIRRAINTENESILNALKSGKSATAVTNLLGLRKQKNTKLDPAYINQNTVIITNQTGFDRMDSEVDSNGRPMLSTSFANPTQKLFDGHRIIVLSDSVLPEVSGKSPVYVGDMAAALYFIEYHKLLFASSEHVYFASNQTALRIMEGFALLKADTDAYLYLTLGAAA